jgi:L-ascorbate metabolism protein UlaG (beta-lactamase superfamily)
MWFIYLLLALITLFFISILIIGFFLSTPGYKGPATDHFDGKKFRNLNGVEAKGFKDIFKWLREGRSPRVWKENLTPSTPFDGEESKMGECRISFINHSTFFIQIDGLNILTDPVWSKHASPFQFAGPKRMKQPGLKMESLGRVDFILLTHNHYDHLDLTALKRLDHLYAPRIITALGVDLFLHKKGFRNIQALDWWEKTSLKHIKLHSTPTQHFSSRGIFDRDRSLWCGFVLQSDHHNIYYVGDSGYGAFFKEIGDRLGPFDASIIPIGAFKPEWFMQPIHVNPAQAIQIHHDVSSKMSIACHYGTFPLADDSMDDPVDLLTQNIEQNKAEKIDFRTLEHGESILVE